MYPPFARAACAIAGSALAAVLVGGCGGGDGSGDAEGPRPTPTRSVDLPTPERTRPSSPTSPPTDSARPTDDIRPTATNPTDETSPTPETNPTQGTKPTDANTPTREPAPTRSEQPRPDRTLEPTAEAEQPQTAQPSPSESPTTAPQSSDEASGTPAWMWWLLAAVVVVAVAAVVAAVVRARRRRRWLADLGVAEQEVVWFAHVLLPELQRSVALDEVAGGWRVASPRVGAAEDRLTVLESTAPSPADASRAQTLRDAVRLAGQRLDSVAVVAADTWALELDELAQLLEVALGPVHPPAGQAPPTDDRTD